MMAMETSSPLAALQSSRHPWDQIGNAPEFDNGFLRPYRPARDFNFRDMSMKRSSSDYFSFRPARGSSPTQSLAVDLSQNFHIDQSPRLATPRRSLFTTGVLKERSHNAVTPPVPSSSPVSHDERMECSPLPHKIPPLRLPTVEVPLSSPSPEPTPVEPLRLRPSAELHRSESDKQTNHQMKLSEDRKLFNPMRPGIRKGLSSNNIPLRRPKTSDTTKPFCFGTTSHSVKPSLESFAESPPSERKLSSSASNPSLIADVILKPFNGSPIACPLPRRPLVSRSRPGIRRRTMSVQHPDSSTAIREQKRSCTTGNIQPCLLENHEYVLRLPHFKANDDPDGLPRITHETLLDIMDGKYVSQVGQATVIDCRFEYEFAGGHIDGAINYNDKDEISRKLFDEAITRSSILVFHCEYSECRAPSMAKHIRQRDRMINLDAYPFLTYPDIYILDGGYHRFFPSHKDRCIGSYIEMEHKEYYNACERGMAMVKKRTKLSRAQTYAFGQSVSLQESPLPRVPSGLASAMSSLDAMDIDFSSPVEVLLDISSPAAAIANQRLVRRFDSY